MYFYCPQRFSYVVYVGSWVKLWVRLKVMYFNVLWSSAASFNVFNSNIHWPLNRDDASLGSKHESSSSYSITRRSMFWHKWFDSLWQQVLLLIGLRTHFLAWVYAGFQHEYAWVLWLIWIVFRFGIQKSIWDLAFRDLWVLSTLDCCCCCCCCSELEATVMVQRWQNGLQKL
jgi:hypothetical protein